MLLIQACWPLADQLPLVFERRGSLSASNIGNMLTTLRVPILDFRPFAADEGLYSGVRLPGAWAEGEFVRAVGLIQRRPRRAVSDWPSERTFADFRNAVRFPARSIEDLNNRLQATCVQSFRRRLWHALPEVDCLFDYDFSASFGYRRRSTSVDEQPNGSLSSLLEAPKLLSGLLVTVGPDGQDLGSPPRTALVKAGRHLAEHFAQGTAVPAVRELSKSFVKAGRPVLAVEAPGVAPVLDLGLWVERYPIGDLELLSFLLPTNHASPLRCYWISSRDGSSTARRRVRELRIHVLRLHSIYQFLTSLTKAVWASTRAQSPFATTPSAAYDQLQFAIACFVGTLRSARVAGIGPAPNLLSAAFLAHEIIEDNGLHVIEQRLLAAARPDVLRKLRDLAGEEADRSLLDEVLNAGRDRTGLLTINGGVHVGKYDIHGSNIGAVGDNASASDFVQGQALNVIKVGGQDFDQFKLVAELGDLRAAIGRGEASSEGSADESQAVLAEAETAARKGDGEGVKASLAKLGRWVLRLAQATGAAVAAAAIAHAMGA